MKKTTRKKLLVGLPLLPHKLKAMVKCGACSGRGWQYLFGGAKPTIQCPTCKGSGWVTANK